MKSLIWFLISGLKTSFLARKCHFFIVYVITANIDPDFLKQSITVQKKLDGKRVILDDENEKRRKMVGDDYV